MRVYSARHCAIWGVRKMGRKETVELTNMCMVEDGKGNVLVQNRLDPNWSGIVYPCLLYTSAARRSYRPDPRRRN